MHQIFTLMLVLVAGALANAQLITTNPAAPVADQPLTITFDASLGTGGLNDCNCDVYLHTGVVTSESATDVEWRYTATTWGQANEAWKLSPVDGAPNTYTYTFSPSLREYFNVPEAEDILRLALVFRDATGNREGKATGNADIFVAVSNGSELAINLAGNPGTPTYALGRPLPVTVGTTSEATISLYDNDSLLTTTTATDLSYDVRLLTPGMHTIRAVASNNTEAAADSFRISGQLVVDLTAPGSSVIQADPGEAYTIAATSYVTADLEISDGTTVIATTNSATVTESVTLPEGDVTTYTITATYLGASAYTTVTFITGSPEVAAVPDDARPGATPTSDGGMLLHLRAPQKSDVFVVGNFNNWSPTAASRMVRSPNDTSFWLKIEAEDLPAEDLLYQYAIDDDGRFADPYSTLVLDPDDDPFIPETTFPGIPPYPSEKADGILTWVRLDAPAYDWTVTDFEAPDPERMVVYELLIRDFIAAHDYQTLTDTIDYLARLGVNAIELLPVTEFEGNISWGYNVSFHMALDKYYGAPEGLKRFVDAAHQRGIAVILDVVYNHAFGESPLIGMWPGEQSFYPGPNNPYANVTARHPFNVGSDLNHESALTREYVKTTLAYWLREFHVDGFRFDLSKGFTQNVSTDIPGWNAYDASRVAIIKEYADQVWSVDPEAYVIMEHLGESREENELAQYGKGMYFWSGGQPHDAYLEGAMGYNEDSKSDFASALADNRGFEQPSLLAYMESHDEERMVYKNVQFGNGSGSYDITELPTALDRAELASAFFYSLPGPKMLWQFGELGYDYPINYCEDGTVSEPCRTGPKPIVWEYRDDPNRQDLYHTIADLLYVRNNYDYFHGEVTSASFAGETKYVHLSSADGAAAVIGNFGVTSRTVANPFPRAGTWYDYFGGQTLEVIDPAAAIELAPGEYHLYLSQDVARDGGRLTATNDLAVDRFRFTLSPNPTAGQVVTTFTLEGASPVNVRLLDLMGRPVRNLYDGQLSAGPQRLESALGDLPAGTYFIQIRAEGTSAVNALLLQ
ncbi:putative secreted protein (Por secretion system target) [Neolewinella xylanilytica]|uniref:Putative secreted protein (Por secretion system target) n=1 Tax=Neolewinella xylanilytica TaxID=1514080 RepID=A0A2S6I9Y5_9BACT|nr:alpha-amylase family glycosyl hydrolase [Neolewinella xylanilytica]PPK88315.1 putative secreted protein (Por secretion system target) [Neolewinella xylanilytica]